jgi:hypothetical protein
MERLIAASYGELAPGHVYSSSTTFTGETSLLSDSHRERESSALSISANLICLYLNVNALRTKSIGFKENAYVSIPPN